MRRAALAFVVTVVAVVAGIWLREQGPPLEGGQVVWDSGTPLLSRVNTVLAEGRRYSVVQAGPGAPLLLDLHTGVLHRLPGGRLVALGSSGATISVRGSRFVGADPHGRRTWARALPALDWPPYPLGSDGTVAGVGSCRGDSGTAVGLRIEDGSQLWRYAGPCTAQGELRSTHRTYLSTTLSAAIGKNPPGRLDAQARDLRTGALVSSAPGVLGAQLVDDVLLVLDAQHKLSAREGGKVAWLIDPETTALADGPAVHLGPAYPGTPAVGFPGGGTALVDPTSGTLRRAHGWGTGPLARGTATGAVGFGRLYNWDGDDLVARNLFTGRVLWHATLPDGQATVTLTDPEVLTVALLRDNGRHQVYAFDATTGEELVHTRPTVPSWSLLPVGDHALLAASGGHSWLVQAE